MINNNTDAFGCLQNSLFIVSCPHYFENIPKLRTNLFLTARCFTELTKSCYYSNYRIYYVKTCLSNIALNPEKMHTSKIIFAFCCWLQVTQHCGWREPQRGSVPTNVPSPDVSSVFSLLSQLLFFATNLKCQLWLSEELWVMGSANVRHMEKFRIILLSKNTAGCC